MLCQPAQHDVHGLGQAAASAHDEVCGCLGQKRIGERHRRKQAGLQFSGDDEVRQERHLQPIANGVVTASPRLPATDVAPPNASRVTIMKPLRAVITLINLLLRPKSGVFEVACLRQF